VAVILAWPTDTAVTSPDEVTVATDSSDDPQATLTPEMLNPVSSRTVAVIKAVDPTEPKSTSAGKTMMEAGRGAETALVSFSVPLHPQPTKPAQRRAETSKKRFKR
jgi:ethanolamine utilization protein EutP (predicted NTPase)